MIDPTKIHNLLTNLREIEAALAEVLPVLEGLPARVLPGAPQDKLRSALPQLKAAVAACEQLVAPRSGGYRTGPGSIIGRSLGRGARTPR